MRISLAHLRDQGIDFAIFDADASSHLNCDRAQLLQQLVFSGRREGLKIDKAALAFRQGSNVVFYGTPDLVHYLQTLYIPRWTHTIEV